MRFVPLSHTHNESVETVGTCAPRARFAAAAFLVAHDERVDRILLHDAICPKCGDAIWAPNVAVEVGVLRWTRLAASGTAGEEAVRMCDSRFSSCLERVDFGEEVVFMREMSK